MNNILIGMTMDSKNAKDARTNRVSIPESADVDGGWTNLFSGPDRSMTAATQITAKNMEIGMDPMIRYRYCL